MRCVLPLMLLVVLLAGCSAGAPSARPASTNGGDDVPLALVQGRPIMLEELSPILLEVAGDLALQEAALDHLLRQRMEEAGRSISLSDADAELRLILEALDPESQDRAARLFEEICIRRRLGDVRLRLLLERNAMLRALVQDEVEVTEDLLRAEYDLAYSVRYQTRIITHPQRDLLEELRRRALTGESFSDLAAAHSTDSSAPRGGLLEPFSPLDSRYPAMVRATATSLAIDDVSDPMPLEGQFVLVQLVRIIEPPADRPSLADVRDELERQTRRTQERLAMDALASRLLDEAEPVIMSRPLRQAWDASRAPRR